MKHEEFMEKCIEIVIENEDTLRQSYIKTKKEEVFVVWSCKTLQNSKAILSTKIKDAAMYEITLNGDKNEVYVDVYVKKSNECIRLK